MKKVMLAVAVLALCGGMVSCKKNCTCTVSVEVMGIKTETSAEVNLKGTDYKNCKDYQDAVNKLAAGTSETVCK